MVGFDRSTHYRYVLMDADFLSPKALLHTLFHILGRYHEHERPDRDEYVDIIEKNIIKGTLDFIFVHVHTCTLYVLCVRCGQLMYALSLPQLPLVLYLVHFSACTCSYVLYVTQSRV